MDTRIPMNFISPLQRNQSWIQWVAIFFSGCVCSMRPLNNTAAGGAIPKNFFLKSLLLCDTAAAYLAQVSLEKENFNLNRIKKRFGLGPKSFSISENSLTHRRRKKGWKWPVKSTGARMKTLHQTFQLFEKLNGIKY